jgi:hypothetical protein
MIFLVPKASLEKASASEKGEHASQADKALFKVMSSAPLDPQFIAESDFPRQRAITQWAVLFSKLL